MPIPPSLERIATLFESLPERERRELLIHYAGQAPRHAAPRDQHFDVRDVRKDEARCRDEVGIFVRLNGEGGLQWAFTLGPKVQTLTQALAVILAEGFAGATPGEVIATPPAVIPRLIGSELVRLRSRTVYYILERMQQAAGRLLQARSSAAEASAPDQKNDGQQDREGQQHR